MNDKKVQIKFQKKKKVVTFAAPQIRKAGTFSERKKEEKFFKKKVKISLDDLKRNVDLCTPQTKKRKARKSNGFNEKRLPKK
ncbi:hypothetical protein [Mucilaginibacter myungsuensis]|uniref:Uncharacterized protein n=1 Tax=Mucilaginibacter myungsuensis TaxID=649104 RepID=A0A929KZN3_9SPHI|nr:hypothetical protein [Mucilaginibacter myungsuensis]MBE9663557.1 hypothetical protein [Mucilaginibacter myungsuensis]MDN3601425.1 hypothetical protein [Mucilaginibacter myungsuensis]